MAGPIVATIAIVASLGLCETVLRLGGAEPWRAPTLRPADEVAGTMFEEDHELGWRPRPGRYRQPPYAPDGTPITMTILPDGARATTASPDPSPVGTILLVGDSFTLGWAVSDDETFAWKLQARWPRAAVVNRAWAGYGTLQSLVVLERALPTMRRPVLVLYGFITHHEQRNVASPSWLEMLAAHSSTNNASVPYATLGDGTTVVRHEPASLPELPLRRRSALVGLLERAWFERAAARRTADRREVTDRLLLAMQDLATREGARFAVVLLTASEEGGEHYVEYLSAHGVDVVDCSIEVVPALRVPGEIHPNGVLHGMYADCIANALAERDIGWLATAAAARPGP